MDLNDFEKELGTVDVKISNLLQQLLILEIHNNSMLKVIVANQAKIFNSIDSSIDTEIYEEKFLATIKEIAQQKNLDIISKLTS
jgi:hypothetical protein